jgi:2-octaprenyl-6-methoxyphenol hydroxylase
MMPPHENPEALPVDVAIVGGGLVGMTLGIAVGGAGMRVAVIDRLAPAETLAAPFDGRASAIAFASHRALAATGIWPHLADHAEAIREIRVSDRGSLMFLHYDHRELGDDGPLGFMLENRHIRQGLHARAAEIPALSRFAPASVVDCRRTPDGAALELDDGTRLTARLVVAADGRDSALRRDAGIGVVGWPYDQSGIVCTIAHERPHRGIAHERFLPGGPFAILPLRGERSSLVWTEPTADAARFVALDQAAFEAEVDARVGGFLGAVSVVGPRWSYPLALHNAERYVDRRLALVGDAAHGMHPIAGQGLNLGLRDVAALAEVLTDAARIGTDVGSDAVLRRYQRWRTVDSAVLLAVTDGLNRLFGSEFAPVRVARDVGLATVNRIPALKRFFMRHARGTVGSLPRLLAGTPL